MTAATIWLRVSDDAKQPIARNRQPLKKMPAQVPPNVPASNDCDWLVKCRTMNRPAMVGSHIKVKNRRRREFRRHHLAIAHRRRHQRFKRAGRFFLREQPHRDRRRDQDQNHPEQVQLKNNSVTGIANGSVPRFG